MRLPEKISATLFAAILIAAFSTLARPRPAWAESRTEQQRNADLLEKMAHDAFGTLSPAELKVVRGAPFRELPWVGPDNNPDNPANDVAKGASWGPERTIRAEILSWLCTEPDVARYVHPSG